MMVTSRRSVLRMSLGLGAAAMMPPLATRAFGQSTDYRALVCLYLDGGLDSDDVLIPYDQPSYDAYAAVRAPLHAAYAVAGVSRARDDLLPLTGAGARSDGRAFAVPPEMLELARLYDAGSAAIVANAGPLEEQTTALSYASGGARLPPKLFSHADQLRAQMRLSDPAIQTGWGGRAADALGGMDRDPYSALAAGGNDPFWLYGAQRQPLFVDSLDPAVVGGTGGNLFGNAEASRIYEEHLLDPATSAPGPFAADFARRQADGVAAQNRLAAAFATSAAGASLADGTSDLLDQLGVVARAISLRDAMGTSRQIFYVGLSGFDTHQDQAGELLPRLRQIDTALGRFSDWLRAEGLSDSVTLFTASDFGRTLQPNATGTDHGWGGHQIVVGGAVRGGRVLGEVPPAGLGHDQDVGRGRIVPTTASEQVAVPLARWLGVAEADIPTVFPKADRFDLSAIDLFG